MKIDNILAFRNDRFGEFLLTIPALRALKQHFAQAQITLVVDPYVEELAHCIDCIDNVITWEARNHTFCEIARLSNLLRKKRFALCVIFNPSKEFNIISFAAGIPMRLGYAKKCSFLLTHTIPDRKYMAKTHEIDYNLELVEKIGCKVKEKTLSLKIEDNISNALLEKFKINDSDILVAVHPWTSDPLKQWPEDNFLTLVKRLPEAAKIRVVIVGGASELAKNEALNKISTGTIINLTGKTSLVELAALLKKCALLISGDSGPVHLAASVGTPAIVLFRNDLEGKTATRWGPWGQGHIVIEKKALNDITLVEVLDKVKLLLSGNL